METLEILIAWEIWSEHNTRVFNHKFTTPLVIFDRIRAEAYTWVKAVAKHLSSVMLGE